jgi:hypothetical protein
MLAAVHTSGKSECYNYSKQLICKFINTVGETFMAFLKLQIGSIMTGKVCYIMWKSETLLQIVKGSYKSYEAPGKSINYNNSTVMETTFS